MPENTDPKTMTDEELDKLLETPVEEEPDEPEQVVDPNEVEEVEDPEELEEEVVEKPVSRREQLRIQQLLSKIKEQPQAAPTPKPVEDVIEYDQIEGADPELVKQLNEDRARTQKAFFNQGLEQTKSIQFHTRLEVDAPRVEAKYQFLDKNSDKFNEFAADAMNSKYLQFVGYDPATDTVQRADVRYSDFVEAEMEFAAEVASHKIADATKNIKRQAAQTGLRPDGSSAKKMNLNKPASQMTDEELDAAIALGVPSR